MHESRASALSAGRAYSRDDAHCRHVGDRGETREHNSSARDSSARENHRLRPRKKTNVWLPLSTLFPTTTLTLMLAHPPCARAVLEIAEEVYVVRGGVQVRPLGLKAHLVSKVHNLIETNLIYIFQLEPGFF